MFGFFTRSSETVDVSREPGKQPAEMVTTTTLAVDIVLPLDNDASTQDDGVASTTTGVGIVDASAEPSQAAAEPTAESETKDSSAPVSVTPPTLPESNSGKLATKLGTPVRPGRRFSWRTMSFLGGEKRDDHKVQLSSVQEREKRHQVATDHAIWERKESRSDRRARASAQVVRSFIVGPSMTPSQPKAKISSRKLEQVKSELVNPKSANRVIAQLRAMPSSDHPAGDAAQYPSGPIHAVCFAYTDADAHEKHFSKLTEDSDGIEQTTQRAMNVKSAMTSVANVTNASLSQIATLFSELHIVSLITAPDLGLETVLQGVQQITPQLMALGYATGNVILPDHSGVYPPTDRMSVITYWWGFEVALPPPSIKYLAGAPSVAHAVINFLTGLSMVNNGVREILPFIRYIAQYIDSEFNMIKQNDHGKGVVCAATWLLPPALVPRPWDFPDPPRPGAKPIGKPINEPVDGDDTTVPDPSPSSPPTERNSPVLAPPLSLPYFPASTAPNTAPPVDETPVDVAATALDESVPDVRVIPPTPPATETLRGAPEGLNVAETDISAPKAVTVSA
ncbi:hypothetical protein EUX98_g6341 [Antrodiella citrinella]|uniref:Uncharacterized protein n=1 Tax=Antrodiella citrinella TaxID=2447956 RepID=A0A4S4MRX0_9APHY|nr:hypothetical protein EUX98_g6341 [Antrodiella citrinella]